MQSGDSRRKFGKPGFFDLQVGDGVTGGGISTKEAMILKFQGLFRVNSYVGFWGSDLE